MSFKTSPVRRLAAALTLVTALVAAGCATTGNAPKTRIDYDKSADFSVYRTYGFPKETGTDRGGYSTLVTSYRRAPWARQWKPAATSTAKTIPTCW
jgi:hypothetical protein